MTVSSFSVETYRLPEALVYLLHRNAKAARALAEKAFAHDSEVTFTQFVTLIMLRDRLVNTPGEIARQLDANTGAVTRMLDQLADRQFIHRERSLCDRRSITILLTDDGRAIIKQLLPRLVELWSELLVEFTDDEHAAFVALQQKLQAAIARYELKLSGGAEIRG